MCHILPTRLAKRNVPTPVFLGCCTVLPPWFLELTISGCRSTQIPTPQRLLWPKTVCGRLATDALVPGLLQIVMTDNSDVFWMAFDSLCTAAELLCVLRSDVFWMVFISHWIATPPAAAHIKRYILSASHAKLPGRIDTGRMGASSLPPSPSDCSLRDGMLECEWIVQLSL